MSKNYMNDSQASEIVKYISDTMKIPVLGAGGGFAPLGTVNAYMGTTAPQGWLICNGQTVNIADYPELATHFASHFGSANFFGGDGTTTIAVPDLRGEFLRGSGINSHTNQGSGANVGVHQDGTETPSAFAHETANSLYVSRDNGFLETADNLKQVSGNNQVYASGSTQSPGYYFTSRPTNTSVTYIIKATDSDAHLDSYKIYSPNEHQVGWWQEVVDGLLKQKPVYDKTVKTTPLSINTWTSVASISGLSVISANVRVVVNSTRGDYLFYRLGKDDYGVFVDSDNNSIRVFVAGVASVERADTTIQYTKTTDSWTVVG